MTDEQRMREQFEEWVSGEGYNATRYGDGPFDRYHAAEVNAMWDGYRARDAEVQALREALGSIVHASNNWAMPVKAFDVTGKLADIARAALAGGETGETE